MISKLSRRIENLFLTLWREVAKFGAVGGVAFIIDSAIFLWLISGPMDDSQLKAKVVSGVVATLFSWVANRYWTFRHRRQANVVRELVMFIIMNAIGLGIAAACVWVTKYWLGLTDATSVFIAGSVVGLILGTIFRFFAYRFWVFGKEMDQEEEFAHDHEILGRAQNETGAGASNSTKETDPRSDTGSTPEILR